MIFGLLCLSALITVVISFIKGTDGSSSFDLTTFIIIFIILLLAYMAIGLLSASADRDKRKAKKEAKRKRALKKFEQERKREESIEAPQKYGYLFDEMKENIEANGNKITYANKDTGTITYKDKNGDTYSTSAYNGYNSRYKDRK